MAIDNNSLGRPLASGRTADVYAWGEGRILKRFHKWLDLEAIRYEAKLSRAVHASGLPVPLAGEILEVGDSHGLVYERVNGPDMFTVLQRQPWRVFSFARRLAALHARMHALACPPGFPSQRERLERKMNRAAALPHQLRLNLMDALERMPAGDRVCHGDFHPGNVLLAEKGEVIIDWIDASCGNPLADVSRSSIIALGAADSDPTVNVYLKVFIRLFHALYIRDYFRIQQGDIQEYRHWLPIVAAARLSEGIQEQESWLLKQAQEVL